jgi:phytoene dehydrogenase-like protein
MNENHTVVIGGGLSGLAAATYLARGGAQVTVLEKSAEPGGRASTDTPAGFALNRGAHALYTGGAASEVFKELGVAYAYGKPGRLAARDAKGLHTFPSTAVDLLRTSLLDAGDKAEMTRILLRFGSLRPADFAFTSVEDWIAQTTHRPKVAKLLRSIGRVYLYTSALDLASAEVFILRFQQTLKHPVEYVDGGWQNLVKGLQAAARGAGVEVLTSSSAEAVQVREGAATAVRLRDGRVLDASSVVIAVPPEDALHLLPEQAAPQLRRSLDAVVAVHIACLDLALERLPVPHNPVVFDLEQPRFLTAQSEFARLAPNGGAVVHLFEHLDPRQAGEPRLERASMEALMDEVQPGWREIVLEQRFLPRMLGVGALPLASEGGLASRPANRSEELDNVYFAGDWVGPEGYLVDTALASARNTARMLLADQRSPRLVGAGSRAA